MLSPDGQALTPDVTQDEVFSSGFAAVAYLKYVLNFPIHEKNVFVIGGEGIERELELEGFSYKGGTDPAHNVLGREDWVCGCARLFCTGSS